MVIKITNKIQNNKVLAGAASLSAINFVAPLFLFNNLSTVNKEIVSFIHTDVRTGGLESNKYSSSSRGSLPLPFLLNTSRKEICQAYLPLVKYINNSLPGESPMEDKLLLEQAEISINHLVRTLNKWVISHSQLLRQNEENKIACYVEKQGKKLIKLIKENLQNQKSISVSTACIVILKSCYSLLAPKASIEVITLKDLFLKLGNDIVNRAAFFTCLNYIVQKNPSHKSEYHSFPFNGFISLELIYREKTTILSFNQIKFEGKSSIRLKNSNDNTFIIITIKRSGIKVLGLDKSDYLTFENILLTCRGSLAAEHMARLGRTVTIPWYLEMEFLNPINMNEVNSLDVLFEEVISPLKSTSIERRPIVFGGKGHRLYPSGYTLMDYQSPKIKTWIEACLGVGGGNNKFHRLLKSIADLNFFSDNSKCTNESRALTITGHLIRNISNFLPRTLYIRTLQADYRMLPRKKRIDPIIFIDLLSGISIFNELSSFKMLESTSNGHNNSLNIKAIDHTILLTKVPNLNLLVKILFLICQNISDHFYDLTKGKINLLSYTYKHSKLLQNNFPEKGDNKETQTVDIIALLINNLPRLELKTLDKEEVLIQLRKTIKIYRTFFTRYLAALVQYWLTYSTYCLKASLPTLALFLNDNELNLAIDKIFQSRGETRRMFARTIWR